MPLVINARFQTRSITGVERYAHELTCRIRDDVRFETPSPAWRGGRGHLWEQAILPARVRRGEWLFSPANTGPLTVRNQIVTLHDLSPIEHPEWFSAGFALWYRVLWPLLARRVKGILTVSEFSRQRIITRLGVPPEKVIAIPNGVDPGTFQRASPQKIEQVRQKYGLEKDFLLFVGSIQPRKNLPRMLSVWKQIQPEFPEIELVVAGTSGSQFHNSQFTSDVPIRIHTSQSVLPRFLGYIPDTDLPALYSAALGLVHPGLYEGSGLTLLEAMACGCPVMAANNTALPEVIGEAGLLFNPYDESELAKSLSLFLNSKTIRDKLRVEGDKRVRPFTWDRTCDEFHEALHIFRVW